MTLYMINDDPITARTDIGAIRTMRAYLKANPDAREAYLEFYREADGQRGYLNPAGASITGANWAITGGQKGAGSGRD